MKQVALFDDAPQTPALPRKPNTTADGELACAFGTPWLDHFDPPVGNGKGCPFCDDPTHGKADD